MLWFLFPKILSSEVYLSILSSAKFIELHNKNKFDELVKNTILPIHKELANGIQIRRKNIEYGYPNRVSGFERHMANMRRRQRRF